MVGIERACVERMERYVGVGVARSSGEGWEVRIRAGRVSAGRCVLGAGRVIPLVRNVIPRAK